MTEPIKIQSNCERVSLNTEALYTDDLYAITFDPTEQADKYYTGFKVTGNSMFNNTGESLCEGDRLICKAVEKKIWNKVFTRNNRNFVIVIKTGEILVRRISVCETQPDSVVIHALNPEYPDIEITANHIIALFTVEEIIRSGER